VSNAREQSLIDRRTFYIQTRAVNATRPQFHYTQPYQLSVIEGVAPLQLAQFTADTDTDSAVCYYIVGQSLQQCVCVCVCVCVNHIKTASMYRCVILHGNQISTHNPDNYLDMP